MDDLPEIIKESYRKRALKFLNATPDGSSGYCGTSCCQHVDSLLPPSFGCVNSFIDMADLKRGDVVIDFGSGAGHDVLLAAKKVGPEGSVIGVDFTLEMVKLGKKNAKGFVNVSFVLGDIQNVPLEKETADVVLSNCVINLVENKGAVFREAFRLLKPGGRVVVADMITMDTSVDLTNSDLCACIGGAVSKSEYVNLMQIAGFSHVSFSIMDNYQYQSDTGGFVDYESVIFTGIKK